MKEKRSKIKYMCDVCTKDNPCKLSLYDCDVTDAKYCPFSPAAKASWMKIT